ncbi:P2X purinoceptor 5-like [Cololabis saira]|uniref:P2X purinoceptor 5-like n=1 Tax=Cololabis saira TaxID=129043 RepID=UPI002AD25C10|nr:P2X purinoceptor 5-like [Cololabis saira]
MAESNCKGHFSSFFNYSTDKFVVTGNKKVGCLYRLMQLFIVGYIIVWVFLYKKDYQENDVAIQSSVITKLKGVSLTNSTESGPFVWGPEDYVIPSQGEVVLFIVTSFSETPNQTLGFCPESAHVKPGHCQSDKNCTKGLTVEAGHGVMTGRCIRKNENASGTCEIYGWCPTERQFRPRKPMLTNAENFTIYIKNFIHFPTFEYSKSNVLETTDKSYLKKCRYNEKNDHYCPIFYLGDIVKRAGHNFQDMATLGGSIGIGIQWECDLDRKVCDPQYHFTRLDKCVNNGSVATGLNSRYVRYFESASGVRYRTLYKVYGIKFIITVYGKAGKFNIIPTVKNVGAGVALIGFGHFICDLFLLRVTKDKRRYNHMKYEDCSKKATSEENGHLNIREREITMLEVLV